MLNLNHGQGISMVDENVFTEIDYNPEPFLELISLSDQFKDSDIDESGTFVLESSDNLLFMKLEQIINSFELIGIKVVKNKVVVKTDTFKRNENPSLILLPNFPKLYWFIRVSLMRNLLKQ